MGFFYLYILKPSPSFSRNLLTFLFLLSHKVAPSSCSHSYKHFLLHSRPTGDLCPPPYQLTNLLCLVPVTEACLCTPYRALSSILDQLYDSMEHTRHFPLPYPSSQLQLEDNSDLSRGRQPLSTSAGNSQLPTLASTSYYHDSKDSPSRERSLFAAPTVPSQPQRCNLGGSLELRRRNNRNRQNFRLSRNPIADSAQYQAYREKIRDADGGDGKLSKWPDVLEDAFLDGIALLDLSLR
jgi:hypothetical protein